MATRLPSPFPEMAVEDLLFRLRSLFGATPLDEPQSEKCSLLRLFGRVGLELVLEMPVCTEFSLILAKKGWYPSGSLNLRRSG